MCFFFVFVSGGSSSSLLSPHANAKEHTRMLTSCINGFRLSLILISLEPLELHSP
jgi:hypothetical protein